MHFMRGTLHLMICVYGRVDPAVLIIQIRLTFGSTVRRNTNSAFCPLFGPNRIRIEYSVQPYLERHENVLGVCVLHARAKVIVY